MLDRGGVGRALVVAPGELFHPQPDVAQELVAESGGGVVVPFGNAERLADEIESMLNDPERRKSMGENGYKKALEYEGNRLWQRNMEVFENVARRAH